MNSPSKENLNDFDETMLQIRGWLKQKTSAFRMDRQVFAIVTDKEFLCYKDDKLDKIEFSVALSEINQVINLPMSSRPGFTLLLKDGKSITFIDTSIHRVHKWIYALQIEPTHDNVDINSFTLLKVIGRGASGKVFLAKRKNTDDYYAIKVLRKDEIPNKEKEKRVRAERNALMRAKNQFITRLFYAFQTPENLYFVLEYVPGGDLRHHIDNGVVFSREQIQIYLAELVIALRSIHNIGIVYRDLKPENILLDDKGHLKLADFGLAREIDKQSCRASLCGTVEYIAPEMLKREALTYAVDWWAFGVIAYQLLCGRLPFTSGNRERLFDLIVTSPPRLPPTLDNEARNFLTGLLEKNPAHRLGSIGTDIAADPFFDDIDWDKIENRSYELEFVPYISGPESVENFDEDITCQEPIESYVDMGSLEVEVQGFSYVDNYSSIPN